MRLLRGRMRKSSSGRISCQRSSTGCTLVKNRWPPMSKRQPSRWAVREMPPTMSSASMIVLGTPCLWNWNAAVRPAGPAPMTTTSWSVSGVVAAGLVELSGIAEGPSWGVDAGRAGWVRSVTTLPDRPRGALHSGRLGAVRGPAVASPAVTVTDLEGSRRPDTTDGWGPWRIPFALLVGGALVCGLVLRFVARSPLWLDEALSVNTPRLPISQTPGALRHDGHPPLYYV